MTAKMNPTVYRQRDKQYLRENLITDFMQTVQRDMDLQASLMGGVDVNKRDQFGFLALHWAIFHGNMHNVKLLLACGSTLDVSLNLSAPFCAVLYGQVEVLRFFIERGIDPSITQNGLTLLEYAARLERKEIVHYLAKIELI
jgi:ankyrin repeat protein